MNNNKNLLTEVSRIDSLMGVEKKILLEQPGALDDLLELGIKQSSGFVDNALSSAIKNNAELFDAIKTIDQKNLSILSKMDELIATTIRLGDEKLADDIIDVFINSDTKMSDEWIDMVTDATSEVKRLVNLGKSVDDAVSEVSEKYANAFKNSETFPNEFFDKFARDFDSELKDLNITPPVRTTRSTVDNPRATGDSLPNPEDVQKEIESWDNWDKIPNYTSEEIDELLTYNRLSKWLKDVFTSKETILLNRVKRFNKLSKAYATSVEKGAPTKVQVRLESEMIKELEAITETGLKNRKEAETWIKNTIDGFKTNKKGVIIDPSEKRFYEWAKKVRNKDGTLKNPSEIRKLNIRERVSSDLVVGLKEAFSHWKKYPELWNRIVRKKAPDAPLKSNFWPWFLKGSRRGNPWRKWNKSNWDDVIDKKGLSAAKKQYLYELIFRYFQWNILWGIGATLYQSINASLASKDTREKVEGCINARALPDTDNTKENKLKQYCESIKTMEEIQLLHYWEDPTSVVLLKNIVYDWDDKDSGLIDTFTDLFPGKLDDVILDVVIPYFAGTRDAKTIQEWQDMWGDAVDDVSEQAEEAEEVLRNEAEENGITLPTGDEDSTPQPGSIEDVASKLDRPTNEVTQDGDIFIWTFNGQEMGRYKFINGELERQ